MFSMDAKERQQPKSQTEAIDYRMRGRVLEFGGLGASVAVQPQLYSSAHENCFRIGVFRKIDF